MTDEKIAEIAHKVDSIILDLCHNNDIGPLALSGIIAARLTHFNDQFNQGPDWRKLCEFIRETPVRPSTFTDGPVSDVTEAKKLLQRFQKGSTD